MSALVLSRTVASMLGLTLLGASMVGCAARARVTGVSADATYVSQPAYVSGTEVIIQEPAPQRVVFREPPPLVAVEPDVYVVEDASYAIYFVSGFYWHVGSGDRWYRTSRWDEPWVHVGLHIVPPRISHRDHRAYVRFRASTSAHVWRQPRERGANDRTLRVVERGNDRSPRAERHVDRRPTPAAGPRPDLRRKSTAPRVDRDIDGRGIEPPQRAVQRQRVEPNPRVEVERKQPRASAPERARPDKKKKERKKVDEKRKPKDGDRQ